MIRTGDAGTGEVAGAARVDVWDQTVREAVAEPGAPVFFAHRGDLEVEYEDLRRRNLVADGEAGSLFVWIRARHRMVSRKYYPNYAAQWRLASGRPPARPLAALTARVLTEPYRPRRDLAGAMA
ncbi:MAG: hypothetical protein H0V89_11930 [Deltaproteobacteria bacterium]|nr:hypothetical protein [Deltaproteobacteria bacterium]